MMMMRAASKAVAKPALPPPTVTAPVAARDDDMLPRLAGFPEDLPDLERVPVGLLDSLYGSKATSVASLQFPSPPSSQLRDVEVLWERLEKLHDLNALHAEWLTSQTELEHRVQEYSESAERRIQLVELETQNEEARFTEHLDVIAKAIQAPFKASASAATELKRVVALFERIHGQVETALRFARDTVSFSGSGSLEGISTDATSLETTNKLYIPAIFVGKINRMLRERSDFYAQAKQLYARLAHLSTEYETRKNTRLPRSKAVPARPVPQPSSSSRELMVKKEPTDTSAVGVKREPEFGDSNDSNDSNPNTTFLPLGDDLQKTLGPVRTAYQLATEQTHKLDDKIQELILTYRTRAAQTLKREIQQRLEKFQLVLDGQSEDVRKVFQRIIQRYHASINEVEEIGVKYRDQSIHELHEKLEAYSKIEEILAERHDTIEEMGGTWPATMSPDFGERFTATLMSTLPTRLRDSYFMSLEPTAMEKQLLESPEFRMASGRIKRPFQRIMKPLASFDPNMAQYHGFCKIGGTGSGKTVALEETIWSAYDAAVSAESLESQRWVLVLVPSFAQVVEWLHSFKVGRDQAYRDVDVEHLIDLYTTAGEPVLTTKVLAIPLPGVRIPRDDAAAAAPGRGGRGRDSSLAWMTPNAIKVVFHVMTARLPEYPNFAKIWAKDYEDNEELDWIGRLRQGSNLPNASLMVDYEHDPVYAVMDGKERNDLQRFQTEIRDRVLAGALTFRKVATEADKRMRAGSSRQVIEKLRICLPRRAINISEESHLFIDPKRSDAGENTRVFYWRLAFENSDTEKKFLMTGTAGATLVAMSNLINIIRDRKDEAVLTSRAREGLPETSETDLNLPRKKLLYRKASDAEEVYLQNKYFMLDAQERPQWKPGMEEKWMQLFVGYISYSTIQHDPSIYPQISSRFPHAEMLPVHGAPPKGELLPPSVQLDLKRERPTELYFNAKSKQLERVHESLVRPYDEDELSALKSQDLGHIRPFEILVPLTKVAESTLRADMTKDVEDFSLKYSSSECQGEPPVQGLREGAVDYALREWRWRAGCLDYMQPKTKAGIRKDPGLKPFKHKGVNVIPNKILTLQSLAQMSRELRAKVFVFTMLNSKYKDYAMEPTVKEYMCQRNAQNLAGFEPFELVNDESISRFIHEHRDTLDKMLADSQRQVAQAAAAATAQNPLGARGGDAAVDNVPLEAPSVADAVTALWFHLAKKASRLIMFKTSKMANEGSSLGVAPTSGSERKGRAKPKRVDEKKGAKEEEEEGEEEEEEEEEEVAEVAAPVSKRTTRARARTVRAPTVGDEEHSHHDDAGHAKRVDPRNRELINAVLLQLFTDPKQNSVGEYIQWFVGDADSNTGLNISGTEWAILAEPVDPMSQQQGFARVFRFLPMTKRKEVVCIVLKSVFADYQVGQELLMAEIAQEAGSTLTADPTSSATAATSAAAAAAAAAAGAKGKKGGRKPTKAASASAALALLTPEQIVARRHQWRPVDKALQAWQSVAIDCLFYGKYSGTDFCYPHMATAPFDLKHKKPDGYCYLPTEDGSAPTIAIHSVTLEALLQKRNIHMRSAKVESFENLCHHVKGVLSVTDAYTLYDAMLWMSIHKFELFDKQKPDDNLPTLAENRKLRGSPPLTTTPASASSTRPPPQQVSSDESESESENDDDGEDQEDIEEVGKNLFAKATQRPPSHAAGPKNSKNQKNQKNQKKEDVAANNASSEEEEEDSNADNDSDSGESGESSSGSEEEDDDGEEPAVVQGGPARPSSSKPLTQSFANLMRPPTSSSSSIASQQPSPSPSPTTAAATAASQAPAPYRGWWDALKDYVPAVPFVGGVRSRSSLDDRWQASRDFLAQLLQEHDERDVPASAEFRKLSAADRLVLRGILNLKRDKAGRTDEKARDALEKKALEKLVRAVNEAKRDKLKRAIQTILENDMHVTELEEAIAAKEEKLDLAKERNKNHLKMEEQGHQQAPRPTDDTSASQVLTNRIDQLIASGFARKPPASRPILPTLTTTTTSPSRPESSPVTSAASSVPTKKPWSWFSSA